MESARMNEVGTTSSITRSAVSTPATSIVRAILLGERIDTRGLDDPKPLATAPLALRCEPSGIAVVFRYGVVVLFQVSPSEERRLIDRLMTRVVEPYESPEVDELRVAIRGDAEEQIGVDVPSALETASPHPSWHRCGRYGPDGNR